jgi:lipase
MPRPIVFIHGIFQMLGELPYEKLFDSAHTQVPDLPGYGANQGQRASLPAAVEYLQETVGSEPVHLVGHSVGGAVAMAFACASPDRVASIINVEGNFTLKDAFWTQKLAEMTPEEAGSLLDANRDDPKGWLLNANMEPTAERISMVTQGFNAQSATTLQSMSRSVVEVTSKPSYLDRIHELIARGIPIHLVAGERSRDGWDVPEFVLRAARSFTIQPGAGHMMMLEDPMRFLQIVNNLVSA